MQIEMKFSYTTEFCTYLNFKYISLQGKQFVHTGGTCWIPSIIVACALKNYAILLKVVCDITVYGGSRLRTFRDISNTAYSGTEYLSCDKYTANLLYETETRTYKVVSSRIGWSFGRVILIATPR